MKVAISKIQYNIYPKCGIGMKPLGRRNRAYGGHEVVYKCVNLLCPEYDKTKTDTQLLTEVIKKNV